MNQPDGDAKTIFLEAVERDSPVERARFLDAACGGNQALRSRVEQLLIAHEHAGRFLGSESGGEDEANQGAAERPGTVIGAYKLVEQIGEGGFGAVFMAEQQQPVRRKVALKVLK